MLKKIVISLICVFMCFGTITSVSANSSKFSFSLDKNMIFQGYNDIYHEDPTQEPDKLKPNIPPEQEVKIDIVLDNQSEEDCLIKLINENDVVCLENSGVISQQKDVLLSIPYTLESGIYKISVKVGDEEQVKEIYLLENLALNSTPYTNATANGSEIVENLIDGCYMNWVSNEAPSSEKPQEFIFDYGSSFVKINTLSFFTNFGNNHGIKKAEILYYNEQLKKWENIKSETDSDIFEFYWEKNDSTREPLEIKFDKFYEMNKIMIRVIESNQMWGNNTVISEIQTWGYISKEKYNLSQSSSQGIEGIENVTNIEIDYKDYSGLVTFELVNANDLSSLDNPIQYTKEVVNGKLNYSFIIPKGTPIGKYKIKTVIDNIEDYSLFYEISVDKSLLYDNIDEYIDLSTEYKTINGKIENILDDEITTGWEFETTNNQSINFISKGYYGKTNYILSKIKVYCENSDITKVKLEAKTNRTDEKKATVYNDKITLKSDEKGSYFEIDHFVAGLSFEYQLSFIAKGNITINEIELYGLYLSSHLTDTVKVFNNEKKYHHLN